MLEVLHTHRERQPHERLKAGARWEEPDRVFPTPRATPTDPHRVYTVYKGILRQAGLPDRRFHDLRHTAATLKLGWGIHPKVAQERLGHAHVSYTLGTNSHVLPTIQGEAARRMDQLIFSQPSGEQEDR